MERRTKLLLVMLISSVGGPYVFSSGSTTKIVEWLQGAASSVDTKLAVLSDSDSSEMISSRTLDHHTSYGTAATGNVGAEIHPVTIRDALNFNITPSWVVNQWPRVDTTLADLSMQGMRVSLVTGTDLSDIHGSLTYYFDDRRRLQRLTLHGHTGDPSKLIALITDEHGFSQHRSLDADLYLKKWNGKPTGFLSILHQPVVQSHAQNTRYSLKLEINRTDGPYRLSEENSEYLNARKESGRW